MDFRRVSCVLWCYRICQLRFFIDYWYPKYLGVSSSRQLHEGSLWWIQISVAVSCEEFFV